MSQTDDESTIRALEAALFQAFLARDVGALDRVLADDFAFSDPSGPVFSKAQWMEDLAAGDLAFEAIEPGEMEFRHLGDTVLVLGHATLRARYSKSDYNGSFRYIDVYTRRGGEWKLVLISAERAKLLEE
jgi:ketosteroid isomerase-like protein